MARRNENGPNFVAGYDSTNHYRNPHGMGRQYHGNNRGFRYQHPQIPRQGMANNMPPYNQQRYSQPTMTAGQAMGPMSQYNQQQFSQSGSLGIQPGWQQMQVTPFSSNTDIANFAGQLLPNNYGGIGIMEGSNQQSNQFCYEDYVLTQNAPVAHTYTGKLQ